MTGGSATRKSTLARGQVVRINFDPIFGAEQTYDTKTWVAFVHVQTEL